ncbi:predicted protein, partial [Nematostella vectensis]
MCDITLKTTSEDIFPAHKIVLAAKSDYFKALFTTEMAEKNCQEISLDISTRTLKAILKYVYCGDVSLNVSNARSVFVAADYLMMDHLKKRAAAILKRTITNDLYFEIRNLAETYNSSILDRSTMRYICRHFSLLSQRGGFNNLNFETVERVIRSDEVIVKQEEEVFEAVQRWVGADMRRREHYFEQLFRHVRLCSISEDYLRLMIDDMLVRNSLACMKQILKSLQRRVTKEDNEDIDEPRTCLRKHSRAVILFGGMSGGRTITDTVSWIPGANTWSKLSDMRTPRERHAVVTCQGYVYVIGGYNNSCAVDRYDPRTNTWCSVAQVPDKTIASAAVAFEGKIYVLGGSDGFNAMSTVQRYNPHTNTWQLLAPLTQKRKAHCAVVLHGNLYAISGCTYDNDSLASVERLDPNVDHQPWQRVASLRHHRKYACAVASTNRIIVAGGYQDTSSTALRSCEAYDVMTDEWQGMAPLLLPRAAAGMVRMRGHVFVLGGRSDLQSVRSVERYYEGEGEW